MPSTITALVSTPSRSTTPSSFAAAQRAEVPPSPGSFRHPRLTEIIQRQSASSLTTQKIQNAVTNILAVIITIAFRDTFDTVAGTLLTYAKIPSTTINPSSLILLLRILFVTNIVICLRPVLPYIAKKDDVADVPLTPSQRALLGLPSSERGSPMASPGSAGYITPPRYRRDGGVNASSSLQSSPLGFSTGRRSTSANLSTPPLTTSRAPLSVSPSSQHTQAQTGRSYRHASDSPFAASVNRSPLLHKAVGNDLSQSTFTNGSTFGFNLGKSRAWRERSGGPDPVESMPGTPSPSGPKRQHGVNYKWLYDKGARLPRSESTAF